jgi:hypothetical protein
MANIRELILSIESDALTFDEKLAALTQVEETLVAMQQQEEDAIQENVDLIVEAIKVMQDKVDAQVNRIADFVPEKGEKGDKGERGLDGRQGVDGKDGRDGINGKDGKDGVDGISVTDAKIDFDGSLVITLSTGKELNVGEVVAPDLAEKIKVISTMSTNSAVVIKDEGTSISSGVKSINFVGATVTATNSGDDVTVNVSAVTGTVTSVGGTGTVNGISLSGTVTTSGNLTLGGTLDLSSPPAIGSTAASTGAFTTVTSTIPTGTAPFTVASTTQVANLNAATAGSATTLTTGRAIYGNNFDGSAALTQIIASTYGGTGNGFTKFSGATTAEKTYTLPDATTTILTTNAAVTVGQGGTGQTTYTDGQLLIGNSTGNTLTKATLTQGTGITITNGNGSITIAASGGGSGTVTSVGGTGTVNGLTLTGTVTTSGNLTLGGTLDLSSPPAIGGTTPAAGTHTTLNLTGTTNQVSSVAVSSDPAAPSAGNLKTFARTIAGGYTAPAFLNATQAVAMLQPAIANKRISTFTPQTGAVISLVGFATGSTQGTATAAAPSSTSFFTRAPRVTYVSAGTAGSFASWYQGTGIVTLGVSGTPNFGGFYYVTRFGIADTVAAPRTFIGLSSVGTTPTNVEPSTLVNSIGVGQGASNTNLFVYYGGSAAQTPIDLGANFPTGTSNTDWYELTLFAPPSSTNTVYYQVLRLNTGNVASGTLTGTAGTVLPSNTTFLMPRNWRTNNATASAVTLAFGSMYLESDY